MAKEILEKKKKKGKLARLFGFLFIISGLLAASYPFFTQYLYRFKALDDVSSFKKHISDFDSEEIKRRVLLARAYNDVLQAKNPDPKDPYVKEIRETAVQEYARMLEVKEKIGVLKIPKLGEELPVFAGTDESILQKGVGHMEGTSLPVGGMGTHAVLTAHTGLPTARLFTDIDNLEVGDRFYYQNIKETLAYQVVGKEVVLPNEHEPLKIHPDKDMMTLLTCTPYMVNSHRLLVHAERVDYLEQVERKDIEDAQNHRAHQRKLWIAMGILAVLILIFIRNNRKIHKLERAILALKEERAGEKKESEDESLEESKK